MAAGLEQVALRSDGSQFPVDIGYSFLSAPQGPFTVAIVADLSELLQRLASKEYLARTVLDSSIDAYYSTDSRGLVTEWNVAAEVLFGWTRLEALGSPLMSLIIPARLHGQAISALHNYTQTQRAHLAGQVTETTMVRRDRTEFPVEVSITAIGDGDGVIFHSFLRDISERRASEDAVRENQYRLQSILDTSRSAISIRDREFRFILANRVFREQFRLEQDEDPTGRLDSEVLTADFIASSRSEDEQVLAGQRVTREEVVHLEGRERTLLSHRVPLIDSAGQVYAIIEVSTDITDRNRYEHESDERTQLQARLETAIDDGRLLVYSQPIIDLASGKFWGEELLARMRGENGSEDLIQPDQFLLQAEQLGLMPIIDRFMINEALALAKSGRKISVNLSATSIQTPTLADMVIALLATDTQAAANLTIEITETAALASTGAARYFSACLAELGAGLALDDFGTGYGSFNQLHTLKLTTLKIDVSFVKDLASNTDSQRSVKLIVQIATAFGLSTTAEGVEDSEVLELLRQYGVDRAQGYFVGRPSPVSRL